MTARSTSDQDARDLSIRPVGRRDWAALEDFFGPSGAYANCWCMFFRETGAEFGAGCANRGAGNRAGLRQIVAEDRVPGLLAYRADEPVGWVSVAPRPEFGRILRSPLLRPWYEDEPTDPGVSSVVCFWVPRAHRGSGVTQALLSGAVAHASDRGARRVEGYPVDVGSGRIDPASAYVGTVPMFERAGFTAVKRRGNRVVMARIL